MQIPKIKKNNGIIIAVIIGICVIILIIIIVSVFALSKLEKMKG